MKNWFFPIALLCTASSDVLSGGSAAPMVPEISSGLAPFAIGIVAGVFVLYHEWRKKK